MNIPSFLLDGRSFIFQGSIPSTVKLINYVVSGTVPVSGLYDDELLQIVTGSVLTSGLVFPLRSKQGSSEALLLEQGKLKTTDKVLYIGSAQFDSSGLLIGLGNSFYSIIPDGIQTYEVNGSVIYNKLFLRLAINGSLY